MPIEWSDERQQFVIAYDIKRLYDDVPYGLSFRPTLVNAKRGSRDRSSSSNDDINVTNERDLYCHNWRQLNNKNGVFPGGVPHLTIDDIEMVKNEIHALNVRKKQKRDGPKVIVELGVSGLPLGGSKLSNTETFIMHKDDSVRYVGVDIDSRTHVEDYAREKMLKHVHTFKCDTFERDTVRDYLSDMGIKTIDILLIDGMHSVNGAVNDWCYVDLVSPDGLIMIHDTNVYPGPWALMRAIDEDVFETQFMFQDACEHGYGLAWRKGSGRKQI